jgi:ribosomal protein L40E
METPCSVDIVYIEGLSVTPTYTDYSLLNLLSNRDKSYRMSIQEDTEQTGVCRKCQSEIPLQAERCSECGLS